MGINDGMSIHHDMAEVSVRGTGRLHCTDEHNNAIVDRKKTQGNGHQMD